jgi:hypothetical protein
MPSLEHLRLPDHFSLPAQQVSPTLVSLDLCCILMTGHNGLLLIQPFLHLKDLKLYFFDSRSLFEAVKALFLTESETNNPEAKYLLSIRYLFLSLRYNLYDFSKHFPRLILDRLKQKDSEKPHISILILILPLQMTTTNFGGWNYEKS